ncbi:MAG: hypothetical protein ACI8UC_000630, partial [Psychromonas sp.]
TLVYYWFFKGDCQQLLQQTLISVVESSLYY